MWDMERRQRLGESVPSVFFHSHIVQRLDGMMRPPKTEKLFNCEQAEEIKSRTRDRLTIARDTSHARRALQLLKHPDYTHPVKGDVKKKLSPLPSRECRCRPWRFRT
jgi:hypothetical protein